jgi:acyl-CoA synthetase (AMP-forming)/AMP-acid ligase II
VSTSAIGEAFRRVCTDKADLVAIHDLDGHAHTFTTLLVECLAIRRALTDVGATRGSCVVSAIGNRSVFVPLMVACMDLGAALLPVGEATDNEIAALIAKVGAFGLVTDRPVLIPAARKRLCVATSACSVSGRDPPLPVRANPLSSS